MRLSPSSASGVSRRVLGGFSRKTNLSVTALLLFSLGLFSLVLSGCKGGGGGGNGNIQTFHVKLTQAFPVIVVGNTEQFSAATVDNTTGNPVTVSGVTFSWTSSNPGVATIDSTSGVATGVSIGMTTITVVGTNSDNNGVGMDLTTLRVVNPLAMVTPPLPIGALTIPYPAIRLGSGGDAPLTFSVVNGTTLPAGLTLSSSGSLSGTPTVAGVSPNFTVQVTDSETPPASKQMTFSITTVDPTNPCTLLTNSNPSMLNGKYAFLLQGFQAITANGMPVAMAGSFTADGTGKILGGEEDINLSSGHQLLSVSGGSYAVSANGQGCVQLNYSNNTASAFHFALSQVLNASNIATHGRILEFDGYQGSQGGPSTKLASGVMLLQNTSEFALTSLASRYTLGEDGVDSNGGHVAVAGSFSVDTAGNITNLAEDVDDSGSINGGGGVSNPLTGTGTLGAVDTNGRSAASITIGGGVSHAATYVVNTNEAFVVGIDTLSATAPVYSGRAILTAAAGSYPSSLSGNFIFRSAGIDRQGDGAACAASGPCAAVQMGVVTFNTNGTSTGSQFFSQAGVTQQNPISGITYAVNTTTGRVVLTGGQQAPVLYLATPQTGADASEPISAFIAGSNGDPLAFFGYAEAQPAGPYVLNSPPSYIFGAEDNLQIDTNYAVGAGSFASGTFNATRDVSGPNGLFANPATAITLTINGDGTISGPNSLDGVTNSTSAVPGRFFFFGPTGAPAGFRAAEP